MYNNVTQNTFVMTMKKDVTLNFNIITLMFL